jgi:hypothetical protein
MSATGGLTVTATTTLLSRAANYAVAALKRSCAVKNSTATVLRQHTQLYPTRI